MAKWSPCCACTAAVLRSSSTFATCWDCPWLSQVQILIHACKKPTGCLLPVGVFNPVMLYLNYLFLLSLFEWSACKQAR